MSSEENSKTPDVLEVTVAGKTYRLGRIGFLAKLAAEPEIRKSRRAEFKELVASLEGMDSELAQKAIASAFDYHIRNVAVLPYELYEWFNSAAGEVFAVTRSLMNVNVGMTAEEADASARVILDGMAPDDRVAVTLFLAQVLSGV